MSTKPEATHPQRLAAAAPTSAQDAAEDAEHQQPGDENFDELFEQWSAWCRTRRYFLPPTLNSASLNLLGKLSGKSRPSRQPPDAKCSASMAALHLAIRAQPRDALDTQVVLLYYGERVAHIKQVAHVLNISRQHFYRLRRAFGRRVVIAAKQIEADNLAAGAALPHFAGHVDPEAD
jgi:hypothetical protein